ncbi:MAG: hypothetical protein DLM69_12050 [Candidatus Chloroheliales bacterium]|nr:MAG: hypothetical protein DLM69_12050 [Chloroflexota bacterium]
MNKPVAKGKGSSIIFVQVGVVVLVAVVIAVGILTQPQGVDEQALLPPLATATPVSQPRLAFDLNAGRLKDTVQIGLLDAQGVTSTLNLPLTLGASYSLVGDKLLTFATSPRGVIGVFTATYTLRSLDSSALRQFSTVMTATNAIGDSYIFSPAQLSPDGSSIAYLRDHQQFIDNGLRVRLTWMLLRVDLNTKTETTLGSGELEGTTAPSASLAFWSNASNQIYLNLQAASSQKPVATLYPYNADGSGAGRQVTVPSFFYQVSPDGSKIASLDSSVATFTPQQFNNFNRITILDLQNGSSRRIVASGDDAIEQIAWSPDSQSLAYIERLAPPTPVAGKMAAGDLFYHILLKRLDLSAAQPINISEYQAGANDPPYATNSDLAWCGSRLYIQLTSYRDAGNSSATLYYIPTDRPGGFRPAVAGDWPYNIVGCVR